MTALIRAQGLCLNKARRAILENVSITVSPASFSTVIGPNGAGKTMLLKVLLGIERPTAGTVQRKKGLRIGYLPQKIHLPREIPLRACELLTLNRVVEKASLNAVVDQLEIGSLLQQQVHTLSGGEMQQVLLARALLGQPEVLILDEPDQNFDFAAQLSFYSLIRSLYQQYRYAILMVSHNLHLVMSPTQTVYCLNQHIHCSGPPQHVRSSPEFLRLFGSEIAQNLAVFHHDTAKHDSSHG